MARAAKAISGKFKVVRLEIPSTKKSLRNIICGRLEDFMADEGLTFSFPADDQVDSNKDDLSEHDGASSTRSIPTTGCSWSWTSCSTTCAPASSTT